MSDKGNAIKSQVDLVNDIDMSLSQLDAMLAVASGDEFTAYCPAVQTNYLWVCRNLVKQAAESFDGLRLGEGDVSAAGDVAGGES